MSSDTNPLASIPKTWAEFGVGLRHLRTTSLRAMETEQTAAQGSVVISRSQLQRYEAGLSHPKLAYADHLDELYRAGGWVSLAVRSLYGATWDPWNEQHGVARLQHSPRWPALYDGIVWLALKPTTTNVGREHDLALTWGPWYVHLSVRLEARGVALMTGKSEDSSGEAVTLNLDSSLPIFSLRGADSVPPSLPVIDLRRRWAHKDIESREGRPRLRELGTESRTLVGTTPARRRRRRRPTSA